MCDNGSDAPEGDAAVLKWHHQAADPMGVFSPPKKNAAYQLFRGEIRVTSRVPHTDGLAG
jgi:hypothetical protein